jgi:hypothetical protein
VKTIMKTAIGHAILAAVLTLASAAETRRVYFVGNSLTMSTTLDRVHGLFGQRGIDLQFGSQLSAGKSLIRHWNYQNEPAEKWFCWETCVPQGPTFLPHPNFYVVKPAEWRFGRYDAALAQHKWDAVVLQAYQSPLRDDLDAIPRFIRLALEHGAAENFFIYETWPRRPKLTGGAPADGNVGADIDYAAEWSAPYTAGADETGFKTLEHCASRDYFRRLHAALAEKLPELKKPIRRIPVGEVLFAIDAKIKDGSLPGLKELAGRDPGKLPGLRSGTDFSKGANILYADAIHFNPMPHQTGVLGNLISGTTLFTVLSGQDPVGLSAAAYGFDVGKDAALIRAVQETIRDVVSADPLTGVRGTKN